MSIDASATPTATVPEDLKGAGVGRRFLATVVDIIAFIVLAAAFFAIWGEPGECNSAFRMSYGTGDDMTYVCGMPALLYGLLLFAYYVVLEKVLGATLGKLALGLRVLKVDGSEVTWGATVIRTLLRIVDGFFFYLVAAIAVWASKRNQRLGDMAASTIVARR